jgi:Domain of unknown function (DUF1942)
VNGIQVSQRRSDDRPSASCFPSIRPRRSNNTGPAFSAHLVNLCAADGPLRLRPATLANEYIPVKGNLYSVTVTVQVETGEVIVHPWYFAARTEDGTNLQSVLGSVDYELPATHVPQGQKVSGQIGFGVPPGKTITQVVLTDAGTGPQLALWTVA